MQGPTQLHPRYFEPSVKLLAIYLCKGLLKSQKKLLPRYVERDRNGNLSFRVDRGPRIPLPADPTTPEFRAAYNAALVDAIAAEDDSDDWSELEAMHRAQRRARGTAKHGGQR